MIDNNKGNFRTARALSEIKIEYLANIALCYKLVMGSIPDEVTGFFS
jgi:hypothetical protein